MQEKSKIEIRISELLYLCFFALMLVIKGIGLYDGQAAYKVLLLVSLGLLFFKMCITNHNIREWGIIIFVSILMLLVYLNCKEKGILICTLTILGMKGVSVERVFKVGLWTWGITMWSNIIFHLLNIETSGYKVHEKLGLGHVFRWDLGFSHPNVLHVSYLVFCGFLIYNLKEKYQWKWCLGLMAGNLLIFLYSISYTGIIVVTFYLALSWYINIRKEMSRLEYSLLGLIFPVAVVISLLSPILLPDKIFNILNKIFSNRLVLAEYYLIPENIKLFGNNLEDITTHILTMDNAYVFSLVIYGIAIFALIIFSHMLLICSCIKQKRKRELALILCIAIAGITEPFLFNTSFKNISLIFLGAMLFSEKQENIGCNTKWALIPRKDMTLVFDLTKWELLKRKTIDVLKVNKKRIIYTSTMLGFVIALLVAVCKKMPEAYIVPRIHVDIESDETWYIQDVDNSEYSNMVILDYKDAETKMQILDGNIIAMEYIRACVAAFVVGLFATGIIQYTVIWIKNYSKK